MAISNISIVLLAVMVVAIIATNESNLRGEHQAGLGAGINENREASSRIQGQAGMGQSGVNREKRNTQQFGGQGGQSAKAGKVQSSQGASAAHHP